MSMSVKITLLWEDRRVVTSLESTIRTMGTVSSSWTLVNSYPTTRRHIPENTDAKNCRTPYKYLCNISLINFILNSAPKGQYSK